MGVREGVQEKPLRTPPLDPPLDIFILCAKKSFYHLYYHHHNQIFDKHADTGASSTSVGPLPGSRLATSIADLTSDLQVLLS